MKEAFVDAIIDTLKLIPFLFLTYLLMELLEHKTSEKTKHGVEKAGHLGPLFGGLLGAVPQCGFSAAAASLYSGKVITAGTLIAIFLSTSDEMLPIMISERSGLGFIVKVLLIKAVIGITAGFIIDAVIKIYDRRKSVTHDFTKETHEHHHCDTEDGVLVSSLKHTAGTVLFIFIFSLLINILVESFGIEKLSNLVINKFFIGQLLTGLIGLIPNCAASIVLTEMYLTGVIGFGQMMSGLLVGAGVGIMVLIKNNKNAKENLRIIITLYLLGVLFGTLLEFLPASLFA